MTRIQKRIRSQWVINYEPDQDIHVLGGNIDLSVLKPRLPQSYERFLGATYFNLKSEQFAEEANDILATWYFRAALALFQGILGLVESDLPSSCGQLWKREDNDIRQNPYSHPLVYTMTRVRNLALHTGKIECSMENRDVIFLPGGQRSVGKLVLQQISAEHFGKKDKEIITPGDIIWFNRQVTTWSANELLTESAFILMAALNNFAGMNSGHIAENMNALGSIQRAEDMLCSAKFQLTEKRKLANNGITSDGKQAAAPCTGRSPEK
jgi:hypothetical protein